MWALPRTLAGGDFPFATDLLFHPVGAETAFNTNVPFLALVSWPLQGLFGLGVAANLVQFAGVIAAGFAAYLLALHVCHHPGAAFVAGAAFTLAPYRFARIGQFGLGHTEFLAFGLLALLRLYEAPGRRRAVVFGAVLGLTFLTDLYYTVFLLIAAAVVAAWRWRETITRPVASHLAQSGAVAALVGLPLLVAMVRELVVLRTLDPPADWANSDSYSAGVLSWAVPSVFQRVWGDAFGGLDPTLVSAERLAFPGFVILALVLGGVARRLVAPRSLWVALALVFFALSLGPFWHPFPSLALPMPYYAFHFVPVLDGIRVPGRFSVMGLLALTVLAAVVLARLTQRHPRWAAALPAVALALVVVDFYPRHVPTLAVDVPPAYEAIRDDPGRGAVLEVPLQWRTGFAAYGDAGADHTVFLYYATRHGKPLVSGMAARYPHRHIERLLDIPVYGQVLSLQETDPDRPQGMPASFTAADLADLDIGFVVFHRDQPRPRARDYVAQLGLEPLADDGLVEVWKVPWVERAR